VDQDARGRSAAPQTPAQRRARAAPRVLRALHPATAQNAAAAAQPWLSRGRRLLLNFTKAAATPHGASAAPQRRSLR